MDITSALIGQYVSFNVFPSALLGNGFQRVKVLAILDGEAQPTGGMGIARAMKNEIRDCPPLAVLVARVQDAWLGSWSMADAVLIRPLDPVVVARQVAELLRARVSEIPVVR